MYGDRTFQLWEYDVSLSRLMLRSPKSSSFDTNIDVKFWGVYYVDTLKTLHGLDICESTDEEREQVVAAMGHPLRKNDQIFVLASEERRNIVVASIIKVEVTDKEYYEPGLERYFNPSGS